MLTIRQAYQIARENEPELQPVGAYETDHYYSFSLIPKTPDCPHSGDSTAYLVDKQTGAFIRCQGLDPLLRTELRDSRSHIPHDDPSEFV